jgi:phosphomannomutase
MIEFGWHHFNRIDAHLTEKEKQRTLAAYRKGVNSLGGQPLKKVETTDGYKLFVDNGWVLVRASGTEPLIRFYAEADSVIRLDALLTAAVAV